MKLNKEQQDLVSKTKKTLEQAKLNRDIEYAHVNADEALCELLKGLGFNDIVDLFDEVDKWYA